MSDLQITQAYIDAMERARAELVAKAPSPYRERLQAMSFDDFTEWYRWATRELASAQHVERLVENNSDLLRHLTTEEVQQKLDLAARARATNHRPPARSDAN